MSDIITKLCEDKYISDKLRGLLEKHKDDPEKFFSAAWRTCRAEQGALMNYIGNNENFLEVVFASPCAQRTKQSVIRRFPVLTLKALVKNTQSVLDHLSLIRDTIYMESISAQDLKTIGYDKLLRFGLLRNIPSGLSLKELKNICSQIRPIYTRMQHTELLAYLENIECFQFLYDYAVEKIPNIFLETISRKLTLQFDFLVSRGYNINDYALDVMLIACAKGYKKLVKALIKDGYVIKNTEGLELLVALYSGNIKIAAFLIENGASCYSFKNEPLNVMKERKYDSLLDLAEKHGFSCDEGVNLSLLANM